MKTQLVRPLFQFSKVSMQKSNTQKTHEIEASKKKVSSVKLILSPESE